MRRDLIAASLATLLGCNPVFAQVAGIGSPMPGMGVTSPYGMSPAAGGSVAPAGVGLGATELATPGLSPAPPSTLGSGFTVCSAVVGTPSTGATGLYDGGGVGTTTGMSPTTMGTAMGTTSAASASTCNQASSSSNPGTLSSSGTPPSSSALLGIGAIPMGSTELNGVGVSPTPCPLSGPTLPTNGSINAQGAC
jgi:hypothetical protein